MINESNDVMLNRPVALHTKKYLKEGLYFRSAKHDKPDFFNRYGVKTIAITDGITCWLYTHFSQKPPIWPHDITAYAEVTHLEPANKQERELYGKILKRVKKEFPEKDWTIITRQRFMKQNERSKELIAQYPELLSYNYREFIV